MITWIFAAFVFGLFLNWITGGRFVRTSNGSLVSYCLILAAIITIAINWK